MFIHLYNQCKREGFLQRIKEEEGEGCNMYGFLDVNKVAGNFHFAPGKSFQQANVHVHDLLAFQKDSFNVRFYSDTSFLLQPLLQFSFYFFPTFFVWLLIILWLA